LAALQRGEKSTHRACVEAGIVKDPTPLDTLRKAWSKATAREKKAFLKWVESENE
jgi:hypothetical protein